MFKDHTTKEDRMGKKYYFTFGFGQVHENGFHVIKAVDKEEARKKMVNKFGAKWSMVYDESQWTRDGVTQQEKYNLHEVI